MIKRGCILDLTTGEKGNCAVSYKNRGISSIFKVQAPSQSPYPWIQILTHSSRALESSFPECWEWLEQSPWPGWQCWDGAEMLWQPLQSLQDQSRAWEAAEVEEEADEGHGVKAGVLWMNPMGEDHSSGTGIESREVQLCPGAAPGVEWDQCEEPARLGNGFFVLLSLHFPGMGTRQDGELDPELSPTPKSGNWGLKFASPWVPTAQISSIF